MKQIFDRFSFVRPHSVAGEIIQLLVGFAAAYALAFTSWHLVDKRILKLKQFFEPKPTLAKATSA